MTLPLDEIARVVSAARAVFSPAGISSYVIDSRAVNAGDLFFALRGPNHDGHDYLQDVFERGAAAAVVDRENLVEHPRLLPVANSLEAMQQLAAHARRVWGGDVIAVTGSAGKTSTKDTIAHLLSAVFPVGRTIGNFNNHVGLPLSILRLPEDAKVAVLEIGMNHANEIRRLAAIARPQVAVVTNVGFAHIENFESVEGIALAKRELVESLDPNGVAVLNADDPRVAAFAAVHPGKTLTFGIDSDATIRATEVETSPEGVCFRAGGVQFESPIHGRHGILNLLAAIAVASIYGISPDRLVEPARSLKPGKMRGERLMHRGITIWNDCYNSNPDAARGMLDVLRDTPARRRIAVLGEMLELGRWAEPLHRDVGIYAASSGISVLVGIRGAARQMVDAAIGAGFATGAAYFFEDPATAGDALRQIAQEGDAILFKGSRGTRVEVALERFLA